MAEKNYIEKVDEVLKRLTAFRNKLLHEKVVIENGEIKTMSFSLSELKDFAALEDKIIDIERKKFKM